MRNAIKTLCFVIALLFLAGVANGEPEDYWKMYTCTEGLAGGVIRSILQDNESNLWIATDGNGVSKYDGNSFQNFTKGSTNNGLANNLISSMAKQNNGHLWFGAWGGGICRYNGKYFDKTINSENSQLISNFVQQLHVDRQSRLWIGTDEGVCIYDGLNIQNNIGGKENLLKKSITAIYEDRSGNMWFGTSDGFICRYREGFPPESYLITNNVVTSIMEERNGDMWFGTWNGLLKSNGKAFPLDEELWSDAVIWSMLEDKDGTLWFATNKGVIEYNGNSIEDFNASKKKLLGKHVSAVFSDKEGNLWFGMWGGGIYKYDSRIQHYSLSDEEIETPLARKITSAIEDKNNNLWFVTNDVGIFRFDNNILANNGEPIQYTKKDGLISDAVVKVAEDLDGSLWFGGIGGMTKYQNKTFKQIRHAKFPKNSRILPILVDNSGSLWVDIRDDKFTFAIGKYNNGNAEIFDVNVPDMSSNFIEVGFADWSGKVWFGMEYDGLYRYNGTTLEHFNAKSTDGLDGNCISSIAEDAIGNVWLGITGNDRPRKDNKILGGLCMYDGEAFRSVSSEEGLSSDSVTSILLDKDKNLWFGTWHGGVSKYEKGEFINFTVDGDRLAGNSVNYMLREKVRECLWFGTQSAGISQYDGNMFQTLTTDDGLIKNWVKPILADSQGNIWFVYQLESSGKLTRYTPRKIPPIIHVTRINSKEIPAGMSKVEVKHRECQIFKYRPLTLSQSDKIRYLYQLREYDEEWHITEKEQVEYRGLKPGRYTFLVKAVDQDLNHSEPATISLEVKQPWYLRPTSIIIFGIICLGSVILSSFMLYERTKLRRQLKEQEKRSEEQEKRYVEEVKIKNAQLLEAIGAAEQANKAKTEFLTTMSHEIRTPIGVIIGYARLLMSKKDMQQDIRNYSEQIENSGRLLLELINDILDISKIESNRLELQNSKFDLMQVIKKLSDMFRFRCGEKNISWQIEWYECENEYDESSKTPDCSWEKRKSMSPPSQIIINADKSKLIAALNNLLGNAAKFTESGYIALRIIAHKVSPSDGLDSNIQPSKVALTFEIQDTGIGISEEEKSKIFGIFQQGSRGKGKGGIGYGLYLTESYIKLMGGALGIDSEPNVGSRFFFTLAFDQFADRDPHSETKPQRRVKHLMSGYTVNALVVDDSDEYRDILTRMLTNIGVHVTSVKDGEKALDSVRSGMPDIIFMDIFMDTISGVEAAQQIWTEFGKEVTKVIAVSASAFVHERDRFLSKGFDAFIARPFIEDEIYDCLQNILDIEYEYTELGPDYVPQIDPTQITLPAKLLLSLREAAEFYSVTDIKSDLGKLRELSEDGYELANYLSIYLQSFDMKGILDILSKVRQE